jgi:hypothetical protein
MWHFSDLTLRRTSALRHKRSLNNCLAKMAEAGVWVRDRFLMLNREVHSRALSVFVSYRRFSSHGFRLNVNPCRFRCGRVRHGASLCLIDKVSSILAVCSHVITSVSGEIN